MQPHEDRAFGPRVSVRFERPDGFTALYESVAGDPAVEAVVSHADAALARDEIAVIRPQVEDGSLAVCPQCAEVSDIGVFLCDGARCPAITTAEQNLLEQELEDDPDVEQVDFESKQQAYDRFVEQFADSSVIHTIDEDSLPASFRVVLRPGAARDEFVARYTRASGVEEVVDQRSTGEADLSVTILRILRKALVMPQ